jgi:hypothetical protein
MHSASFLSGKTASSGCITISFIDLFSKIDPKPCMINSSTCDTLPLKSSQDHNQGQKVNTRAKIYLKKGGNDLYGQNGKNCYCDFI